MYNEKAKIEHHCCLFGHFNELWHFVGVYVSGQNQQHASVWPYLEWLYNNGNHEFYISVENKGIGPAIAKGLEMKLNNEIMPSNSALFANHFKFHNSTVKGRVIMPGEKVIMFHAFDSAKAKAIDSLIIWNSRKKQL